MDNGEFNVLDGGISNEILTVCGSTATMTPRIRCQLIFSFFRLTWL